MRILIISDFHYKFAALTPDDKETNQAAVSFLKSAVGEYDLLVLNGDIFDLWFDWQTTIIKAYFPFLKVLADIREKGCKIVYISGNHDFWFNDFFPAYLSAGVYDEGYSLQADGKKIYITHGDLHTTNDLRYQLFRRFIRLPFAKKLFTLLHPDLALAIGTMLSRTSRSRIIPIHIDEKKQSGMENSARRLLRRYDYVIMGHSHKPLLLQTEQGIYANCGGWLKHRSYLTVIDGRIELKYFSADKELV